MTTEIYDFDTSPQILGVPFPGSVSLEFLKKVTSNSPEPQKNGYAVVSEGSLEEQKPLVPEIPNPEKDKLIVILNFLLREVLPLPSRQEQVALLVYFFRSILSETQKLPITHLAYNITLPTAEKPLALHDDMYSLRSDLLQVCTDALQSAALHEKEKSRYSLEKQQIEALISALTTLLTSAPHGVLSLLAAETVTETQEPESPVVSHLHKQGWKTLEPAEAFCFIQPSVKEKMKLENNVEPLLIGPKYLYVMPQSEIHVGNMSIMVLAQPVFIPSQNRFILLHDQHMAKKNWDDHISLFQSLGVSIPSDFTQLPFSQKEHFVMSTLVELPEKFQEKTASDTILTLFPEKKFLKKIRQKITRKKIQKMESSLEEYAHLLLDVVEKETGKDPTLSLSTVQKMSIFLKRVVLAGILDTKKISGKKRLSLFQHFQNHGDLPEEAFALSVSQFAGFTSATKAFDTSLLECVALSPFSSVKQLANLQMSGPLTAANLSRVELSQYVGTHRAKEWKIGNCIKCPSKNTWVGECDWCLNCEMGYKASSSPSSRSTKPQNHEKRLSSQTPPPSLPPETVSSFIASLL